MGVVQMNLPAGKNAKFRQHHKARASTSCATGGPLESALSLIEPASLPSAQLTTEQAVILDLFGQPPVMYHRCFVGLTKGGVNCAAWLTFAVTQTRAQCNGDMWIEFTEKACEDDTGLSRREQDTSRKHLREAGVLEEMRRGRKNAYRINMQRLEVLLYAKSAAEWSLVQANQTKHTGT
jgi:hypothetical protein